MYSTRIKMLHDNYDVRRITDSGAPAAVSYPYTSLIALKIHFVVIFLEYYIVVVWVWQTLLNFGSIPLIIQSSTVGSINLGKNKRNDSAGLPRIKSVAAG